MHLLHSIPLARTPTTLRTPACTDIACIITGIKDTLLKKPWRAPQVCSMCVRNHGLIMMVLNGQFAPTLIWSQIALCNISKSVTQCCCTSSRIQLFILPRPICWIGFHLTKVGTWRLKRLLRELVKCFGGFVSSHTNGSDKATKFGRQKVTFAQSSPKPNDWNYPLHRFSLLYDCPLMQDETSA